MAIPREYATSNPVVRDALALQPIEHGTRIGDFVAPDFPIDAEIVDTVTQAEHSLNLDDLRAADAEAKEVRFDSGSTGTISIVERALKTKIDSRKIQEAGDRGVDIIVQRIGLLRDDILDAKEYRIAQLALAAANYAAGHKDITGLNFSTLDLSASVDTWQEALVADGNMPGEYAVIGRNAWRAAKKNTEFRKYAAGSRVAMGVSNSDLTLGAFAEWLGLKEVRVGDFRRKIGSAATATQFWTADSFLLFARRNTLSDRTLTQTAICPYGEYQGVANGTDIDVRTADLPGVELLTEAGVFHRYRTVLCNANLGFLVTGVVGF